MQRPNRFNWHTTSPDESLIVADGKDVWVYDPFVEQVTALKMKDAVLNTPSCSSRATTTASGRTMT